MANMYKEDFPRLPLKDCEFRRVYKIRCRNLVLGVFDGEDGFIGIREKFGSRYLAKEYHWEQGAPFGTVYGVEATDIYVPENIEIIERYDYTLDKVTKRKVKFDKPVSEGGRGWYFLDTNEASKDIHPVCFMNQELFDFLTPIENKLCPE